MQANDSQDSPGWQDEREVEEGHSIDGVSIEDRGREGGKWEEGRGGRLEFNSIGVTVNEPQNASNSVAKY